MKMENVATFGNYSTDATTYLENSLENENFPFTVEDLKNLSREDIKSIFTDSKYGLCRDEKYQELPICQNLSLSFNDSFETDEEDHFQYAFIVELVVPIIFGIVVLVGVFGNSLVVIVIIINKQMRSTTNYLIFSLAVADLLFTVFCVPSTASDYIFQKWPFGMLWCKVVQYLTYVTAYASVYTLLLLSLDRYLAVVHPIYAITIRTERNAVYAIIGTWTLILTSCIPLSIVHGVSEFGKCKFMGDKYHHAAFHIGFITTMYFIPLTVIVGLYLMILHRLWSQNAPGGTRSAESVRGKKRVTRMVVIVVVTFIICWLPIQVVLLLKSLGMYDMSEMTTFRVFLQIFGQVLAYMNSCINPILYAFLSDPFRKAFHKVISCGPSGNAKSRLTYEGTQTSRPVNLKRPSIVMSTLPDSNTPPLRRAADNEADESKVTLGTTSGSNRKRTSAEYATTTTSFITNSAMDEDPSPSTAINVNGML